MSDILQLSNVMKWAGDGEQRVDILRGISLRIHAGEFVAIMGASGSGKSTLLNLMGLLDTPSAGSIHVQGEVVSTLSENDLARKRAQCIGFIFQTFNLLPYLNVQKNIELPLMYSRHANPSKKSLQLLSDVHLQHRAQAYPGTLSGGERQRVAIARALANEPLLLLADEPTGALDSRTGAQIMDLLEQLHRRGSTLVLVTHDEAIARRAQRRILIQDGRLA